MSVIINHPTIDLHAYTCLYLCLLEEDVIKLNGLWMIDFIMSSSYHSLNPDWSQGHLTILPPTLTNFFSFILFSGMCGMRDQSTLNFFGCISLLSPCTWHFQDLVAYHCYDTSPPEESFMLFQLIFPCIVLCIFFWYLKINVLCCL